MRTALLCAAAVLSACATPAELRSGKPAAVYFSKQPAAAVVACLIEHFDRIPFVRPTQTRPLPGGGTSVMLMDGEYAMDIIDVRSTPAGSSLALYTQDVSVTTRTARLSAEACAAVG